jgi:hypothetical protein
MARENDDGLMSSDEEEFDDNTNLAESNMTRQNIDDGEKRSTDFESNNDFVDPQALLDEATVDMEFAGELISTKPMASSETSQTPFGEINTLAEDLRRLSDAILMEDAFTDLAIPALAGSVEGFGFDTIESLNSIDSLSCMDPMIDKLSKEKNKKP